MDEQNGKRQLPQRWAELDRRTIEWIARLNEAERQRLIDVSHLEAYQLERLEDLLSLPEDKWQAGFKVVTRSVWFAAVIRKVPVFIVGLAAFLVAVDQIWKYVSPYLLRSFK
ncbi:MAG TPA: hypothetical protein VMF90_21845 [Rhizobiaceae bacterium]|nr:hypothetical protein [Rhizobiaceae bacterium]